MHISVLISPSCFFIISKVWSWWYTCGRKLFRWKRCRRIEGGLRQVGSWHGSRRASWRIFRHDPSTCQGMGTVMQYENSQTGIILNYEFKSVNFCSIFVSDQWQIFLRFKWQNSIFFWNWRFWWEWKTTIAERFMLEQNWACPSLDRSSIQKGMMKDLVELWPASTTISNWIEVEVNEFAIHHDFR